MKVYIPGTMGTLASLLSTHQVDAHVSYGATPQARAYHGYGGEEALGRAALREAAFDSLRQLYSQASEPRRRVVIAADVPDAEVLPEPVLTAPCRVRVASPVPWSRVTAVHVDAAEPEVAADVAAGAAAVPGCDLGSGEAEMLVAGAERHALRSHAVQEIPGLLSGH